MARVNTSGPTKTGIQNSTYSYAADAQASDTYAITLSPAPSAYATGQRFIFKANTANTGAASLNVNSLGAITLKKNHDQDLATDDIEAGSIIEVVYDSTGPVFQVMSVTAVAPGDVVGPSASIDSEMALFSGTGGKTIKRATLTGVVRMDSGVVSIDSDVTDIVAAGSESAAGKLELATDAEAVTGSDTARAVTPANLTARLAAPGAIGGTTPAAGTFTTITPNTGITLVENAPIALDPAGSADGKYSGITIAGTAGAALAFGQLCYLAVADSRWELADADAAATAGGVMMGICVLAAAADADPTRMLLFGTIRADAQFPALTIGASVYAGETAGAVQVAIPTGADNIIRVVGFALTADEIFFNPSPNHQVTVA